MASVSEDDVGIREFPREPAGVVEAAAEAGWRAFHDEVRKHNDYLPPCKPWAEEKEYVREMYRVMVRKAFEVRALAASSSQLADAHSITTITQEG